MTLNDGKKQSLYFDTNYNSSFALMHEDYLDDAIPLDIGIENIKLKILSTLDLAISKIARFADVDKHDIATLAALGLIKSKDVAKRAEQAIGGFVGGIPMLRYNLKDTIEIIQAIEGKHHKKQASPSL